MIATLISLFKNLPELLALLEILQRTLKEAEVDMKMKDAVKTIHQAIETKDASKIDSLFNSD